MFTRLMKYVGIGVIFLLRLAVGVTLFFAGIEQLLDITEVNQVYSEAGLPAPLSFITIVLTTLAAATLVLGIFVRTSAIVLFICMIPIFITAPFIDSFMIRSTMLPIVHSILLVLLAVIKNHWPVVKVSVEEIE